MILDYPHKTTTINGKKNTYIYLDLGSVNRLIETQKNFTLLIKGLKYTHICMSNLQKMYLYE